MDVPIWFNEESYNSLHDSVCLSLARKDILKGEVLSIPVKAGSVTSKERCVVQKASEDFSFDNPSTMQYISLDLCK